MTLQGRGAVSLNQTREIRVLSVPKINLGVHVFSVNKGHKVRNNSPVSGFCKLEKKKKREVSWCFTPSQPVRKRGGGGGGGSVTHRHCRPVTYFLLLFHLAITFSFVLANKTIPVDLHNSFASVNAQGTYALLEIDFFGEEFRTLPSRRLKIIAETIMVETIMLPTTEESFDTDQQFC